MENRSDLTLARDVLCVSVEQGGHLADSRYPTRHKTEWIVVHVLKNIPETLTESDVTDVCLRLGVLSSSFHFVVLPNGNIEDGRDVTAVGGYRLDSLDIALLCVDSPSTTQERNLDDLIAALLQDYPRLKPQIKVIEQQRVRHKASA